MTEPEVSSASKISLRPVSEQNVMAIIKLEVDPAHLKSFKNLYNFEVLEEVSKDIAIIQVADFSGEAPPRWPWTHLSGCGWRTTADSSSL